MMCSEFTSTVGGFPLAAVVGIGVTLLFWLGLAALVIWVVRTLVGSRRAVLEQPLDILKRRFAAGEISQTDFEQARRSLLDQTTR